MKKNCIYFFSLCLLLLNACSDKSSEDKLDVEQSPYQKWDENTVAIFGGVTATNSDTIIKLGKIHDSAKIVDGVEVFSFVAAVVSDPSEELSASLSESVVVEGSVDANGTINAVSFIENGIIESATGIPDVLGLSGNKVDISPPLSVNLEEMSVGETRDAQITVSVIGIDIPVSVTYGPVEDNLSVETPRGHIVGCRKFVVNGTFTLAGMPLSGDLIEGSGYYHPTLGLVAIEAPNLGVGLTLLDSVNYGDAENGWNVIQKTSVLTDNITQFTLSTQDRKNEYDADKNTHAKMLLELRWADENDALTLEEPDPYLTQITFGTFGGMFYFPHELIESPLSVFFPEENGNGFRYWYAYVDQAAKNQDDNGISYDIIVSKDLSLPDLRVTGRIGYQIFSP